MDSRRELNKINIQGEIVIEGELDEALCYT